MTDSAPGLSEQKLLAMHAKACEIMRSLEYGLEQGSEDNFYHQWEAKKILKEIENKLGYKPQTVIDEDMEALKQKIKSGQSTINDFSDLSDYDPNQKDQIYIGPRGGLYRINRNGNKTYI